MTRDVTDQSTTAPTALLGVALGAAAFGVLAVGAVAIGRIAVGRLAIKNAHFAALEVDELTVGKLRILEREDPSFAAKHRPEA